MGSGSGAGGGPRPPRRRRTAGDFVRAFAAFVALLVLVVGVPLALAYFVGWPLPDHVPTLQDLNADITTEAFVNVLGVVVWLAWAQFTACVLVEAKAAISGVGIPTRVPGSGPSQLLARQLIAAVLLIGASAASLTPGLSQLGNAFTQPDRPHVTASAQQTPGGGHAHAQTTASQHQAQERASERHSEGASAAEAGHAETKFYRIQPPEGRHHDSLWEIAQRHLGDGRRYKEIYELNKDRAQPDGSRLSQASLIRPGWIMEMPADARGGELVEMPKETPKVSPEVQHQIQQYQRTGTAHAQHAQGSAGTSASHQAAQAHAPAASAQSHDASGTGTTGAGGESGTASGTGTGISVGIPEILIGSPLLAAGLLAALGRRRRTALWQSVQGGRFRTPRTPEGEPADALDALRIGADQETVRFLDRALRALSASLAAQGRRLPTVYAAWLTPDALHLQLAWPEGQSPEPWLIGQDSTFWRLERAALPSDADVSAAAPFPGLAALGTLDGARLLLNLEAVPGIVSIAGPAADRTAVLASVAAELATNGWSDRMTVTLVGFAEDLTALAPTRVRHLADVAEVIETMSAETAMRAGALRAAGQDSVLTGRTGPAQHTQWAPHLVLIAGEPTEEQAFQLAELAADSGRVGIGYVVASSREELPGAAWELEITGEGRLLAPLLGLDLEAQLLPARQYRALLDLFAAPDPNDSPDPEPTPPFLVDLTDQGRPGIYARLLGAFELIGVDAPEADRSPLLHESLALLLLHREGVHPRVLASALWPRGVTEDVRDALIDRLRDWLGTDPDGKTRLSVDDAGRLKLSTSVVSDWDVLQTLHHEATDGRGAADPRVRRRLLRDALALARGPLLADRPASRYGWLTHEIVDAQLPVLVAEVALGLSQLRVDAGKPDAAVEAVEAALAISPADERLWLELIRATNATGDPARLAAAADSLIARNTAINGAARGLPPRVEALLDELLPTWQSRRVAN
jgi:DNA-binding SARP family transcriptional activator